MDLARAERLGLCDTFMQVGPEAPTLCGGWLTADLAAHLVIRDSRPDLAAGMFVPPLRARLERSSHELAARDWTELVDTVRSGPPSWSPAAWGPIDRAMNTAEYFIHHEDVLRADEVAAPRRLSPEAQAELWRVLHRMGRVLFRKAATGVVLISPGHGRCLVKGPRALGCVVLTAEPSELLLFGFGRRAVAQVQADGDPAAVSALQGSDLGIG